MYKFFNSNPVNKYTGDCVIRAISKLEDMSWEETALWLTTYMLKLHETIVDNDVWKDFMLNRGYKLLQLPNTCPMCYTLRQFADEHPSGKYLACTGSHVIAVIDGDYYDTWDSGSEIISYFFKKEEF